MSEPLLRTEGLTRHFKVGKLFSRQHLHAVDDVDLTIGRGEIVALVGESGSGKSTIARLLARVYKPTSGEIYFEGKPLSRLRTRRDRLAYASDVPMVFQDPYSSINPAYRVVHGVRRALLLHRAREKLWWSRLAGELGIRKRLCRRDKRTSRISCVNSFRGPVSLRRW